MTFVNQIFDETGKKHFQNYYLFKGNISVTTFVVFAHCVCTYTNVLGRVLETGFVVLRF